MRRTAIAMVAAAGVIFAAGLSAQGKPNFAGKWTLQVDPNAAAAAAGGGGRGGGRGGGMGGMMGGGFCGQGCEVTQDDKTITVKQTTQMGEVTTVYKLDGTDSPNSRTMNMGGNETKIESVSKVTFDGAKMNVVTSTNFNGNARETKSSAWIEGGNLVIETTAPGRQGGDPTVTKQVYKKG